MADFVISTKFTGDDKLSRVMDGMARSSASASRKVQSFGDRLSQRLDAVSAGMGKVKGAMSAIAGPAAMVGAGIGLVGGNIVKAGAGFEEAISSVGAVALKTRDQIKPLEEEALRLGSTTKFTATEAAQAMETMARAGFEQEEILSGVSGVLSAAAASGLEMAEVASVVSNSLKGMGLEANQAGRVADVLALASARTNSTIGTLGESMKNLAPVAKQMGIEFEDAVGMVAMLQDVGLDASEAGTATATMLTKLTKPSAAVAKQMKELGIEFRDAEGNMRPPLEIFSEMQKAAGGLGGNMDQVAFFADLVGLRGQKAALNLKELFTTEKGQRLTEELRNAAGVSQKMADLKLDNLLGDWTLFGSAVDGVKQKIFNMNSGPLRDLVQKTSEWVTANEDVIATKVGDFFSSLIEKLPQIVFWIKAIGISLVVFKIMEIVVAAAQAAIAIYNGTVAAAALVTKGYTFATTVLTAKVVAMGVAFKGAALSAMTFVGSLLPIIAPLLVISATVAAVTLQLKKLFDMLGGFDVVGKTISKMWENKSLDFMGANDEVMNEEARKRFEEEQTKKSAAIPTAGGEAQFAPFDMSGADGSDIMQQYQKFMAGDFGQFPTPIYEQSVEQVPGSPGAPMTFGIPTPEELPVARSELIVKAEPGASAELKEPPPRGNPAQVRVQRSGAP